MLLLLALIWIQTRKCQFDQKLFDEALKHLQGIPGIDKVTWNKFGSDDCCAAPAGKDSTTWSSSSDY